MTYTGEGFWSKVVNLQPGVYAANFALSRELFLPTLKFTPTVSGEYTFTVNLETGAYNVKRFEG